MIKTTKKQRILAISAAIVLGTAAHVCIDHVYHPHYAIYQNQKYFGTYSKGKIYIGSDEFLASLTDLSEDDILVCDERFHLSNPNMKIYSSYRIDDKELRNEILEVLCRYEECYPSPWERSIESMRLEWALHNYAYKYNHRRDRTTDVDLNNPDETKYNNTLIRKLIRH